LNSSDVLVLTLRVQSNIRYIRLNDKNRTNYDLATSISKTQKTTFCMSFRNECQIRLNRIQIKNDDFCIFLIFHDCY